MSSLIVSPLEPIAKTAQAHAASHMVSLMSPGHHFDRPNSIAAGNHLILELNDISMQTDGLVPPAERHIKELISFVQAWDQIAPMLIHCWFGISRSPAAALITALAINPDKDEQELAQQLRKVAPSATPNRKIIELGDHILGRGGKLSSAVNAIGRGQEASSGTPFVLEL